MPDLSIRHCRFSIRTGTDRDGDVRGLRGLGLRARRVPLLDLTLAMGQYGKNIQSAPVSSWERKLDGFWPIESREQPEGKASSPLGLFPAFPGCRHPGWRPKDAGPEARRRSFLRAPKQQRQTASSPHPACSAAGGSRGIPSPWRGMGQRPIVSSSRKSCFVPLMRKVKRRGRNDTPYR